MGIIKNQYIADDCLLGIWEISETFDQLYPVVRLTSLEEETLGNFLNEKRKVEWLSVRALLKNMLKDNASIVYNKESKPFLNDKSYNISISHSQNLTAILVSKHKRVGIDLEYMSHQINQLASKFINEREQITDDPEKHNYHLYIHWCAKEAIYKICDKQDINFKQNIIINPFETADEGTICGTVNNRFGIETYDIHYYRYNNYVIAWCTK
jgi:4'-phosphopantetheinyl transferase